MQWVKVTHSGSTETTTTISGATGSTFTVPVNEIGTFNYRLEVTTEKNDVEFTAASNEFTVTVKMCIRDRGWRAAPRASSRR